MHHPYRDHGESADTTIKNLGAYVRHVHLRDSDDDGAYDLIGEGTLPVGSMMQALSLSLIHISEPTRQAEISYAVFCLKKKKKKTKMTIIQKKKKRKKNV